MRLKSQPNIRFAGQITGVEGYVESAAMGLLAGRLAAAEIKGALDTPPPYHGYGRADHPHLWRCRGQDLPTHERQLWPVPPVEGLKGGRRGRKDRYKAYTDRAKVDWQDWLSAGQEG